jgi:hypothetical protein
MAEAKKKKRRSPKVKLWLDFDENLFWSVPLSVGTANVSLPVSISSLRRAERGYPWSCWAAEAIKAHVKANPKGSANGFPHDFIDVYVIASALFIIDKRYGATPTHAVKYKHNFGPIIKKFDSMSKAEFLKEINGERKELVLHIKPGRKYRGGESQIGGNGGGGSRSIIVSRGARRRAEAAKLLPPRTGHLTSAQKYV